MIPYIFIKIIIKVYKNYLILAASFINPLFDIFNLINNLYIWIINYKIVYKLGI